MLTLSTTLLRFLYRHHVSENIPLDILISTQSSNLNTIMPPIHIYQLNSPSQNEIRFDAPV